MRVRRLQDMEDEGESPLHRELVSRIAGAALSVASLTTLSCAIRSRWLFCDVRFSDWGLPEFTRVVRRRL